ncbi:MAG: hypothetical protein QNJ81_00220 [Acidimicrobiia bacterium]|nr:hypothetical protein [Acidimicrobiia bacterium]
MAGRIMGLLFRPGWRLKLIDPPLGWIRILDDDLPTAEIRLQLTCFLTQSWASPVDVKDAQLRAVIGEREFTIPWTASADPDGKSFRDSPRFTVSGNAPLHAFADFASDAPDLVALLESATEPIPMKVEGLFNAAIEFREVASLDLSVEQPLLRGERWKRIRTGRELTE